MSTTLLDNDLHETIRTLPGYDPFASPGGFTFQPERAEAALRFLREELTFTHGVRAGEPFDPELWEVAVIANLYGWWRGDRRRYRVALVMTGRANGKSELAAAIACEELYAMKSEAGGQLYGAAAKRDQARFIFDPVQKMIQNNPRLRQHATVYKHSIVVGDRSYLKISREAMTEIGGAVQFAAVDELHAHPDRSLVDMLETGMVKRRNPLMLCVSTSDYEREGSPCNQMHDYACKVRDGIIDEPTFLPVIYEATKEDDWTGPDAWQKANPNMGVTVFEEDLRRLCLKAQAEPAFENEFKRLHLNMRTQQAERLIPIEKWDACRGELPALVGKLCWAGLDLGATSDFTAFVAVFPLDDGRYGVKPIFWIPESTARKRRGRLGAVYLAWERAGVLRITPGDEADYDRIEADVVEFAKAHDVREIATDRLFQGAQMIQSLRNDHGIPAFDHSQLSTGMALPTRQFIEHVGGRLLVHDGNPVMRWMVDNVAGVQDRLGNWLMSKKHSGDKIDGCVALAMALGRALGGDGGSQDHYETHEVRSL